MKARYESLECRFTDEELHALGFELGRANQAVYDLRNEKKSAMQSMETSIKAAERHAANLTMKINQKFELREIEVVWAMDTPRPGQKTLVRTDTGEDVRTEAMTPAEMQGSFSFGGGDERKQ